VISVVHSGTTKQPLLVLLGVRCLILEFLCAAALGMAQEEALRSQTQPAHSGMVRQVLVKPHTIILPVVDGKGIRFTRLSTENGLSQTMVWQIAQDDQGFMWFGTQYGLNRYDGYKFKVFRHVPGVASSLSGVYIYSLFKDRSGTLWVGCDDFLDKFDPVTETFTHYRIDAAVSQGETVPVTTISQDHMGMLWLGTRKGLYRFDPSSGLIICYRHDPNNPFSLSNDEIRTTGEDREGTFWVGTHEGLDAFDRDTGKVTLSKAIAFTNTLSLSHNQNVFSLEFSALSYFNPATNRYRYKLDGLDHRRRFGGLRSKDQYCNSLFVPSWPSF